MQRYQKTLLLLSSIVCLLFSSCAISKYKKLSGCETIQANAVIAPVVQPGKSTKFKTSIDVLKNHLTGIVVVKQTDSLTTHIVFVTELGMKMFDFEVKGDSINALYVFEPLNKPTIINVLKENFKNMLLFNLQNKITQQCINKKNETVFSLYNSTKQKTFLTSVKKRGNHMYPFLEETFNGKKLNSKITYVVYHGDVARYDEIRAKQYGLVKFKFELINITE